MLSVHLANIKSSGVYRFVFDKSEVPGQPLQTIRLVVGYSERGPFNTVTYVKNEGEFKEIYGNISKKLEKYGCFFHRLALQCLAKGPILCLNLKKFTPMPPENAVKNFNFEAVGITSFDPFGSKGDLVDIRDTEVARIFNTTRLWTLDPEVLPDAYKKSVGGSASPASKFISIATTDTLKNSSTVFVRPSTIRGYDVTLRDWYNNYNGGAYPDYAEDYLDTLVSDYMVDVYIFRGKFTKEIASSETLNNYFKFGTDGSVYVRDYVEDAFGEKRDALELLSRVEGSGFITRYTGSLIPYFKNTDGSWMSIDLLVNGGTSSHNIMMYLDEDYLESDNHDLKTINLGGYFQENFSTLGVIADTCYGTDNYAAYMFNIWNHDDQGKWSLDDNSGNSFTYGDVAVDVYSNITVPSDDEKSSTGLFTWSKGDVSICAAKSININVGDRFFADAEDKTSPSYSPSGLATCIRVEPVGEVEGIDCNRYFFTVCPKVFSGIAGVTGSCVIRYNCKLSAHATNDSSLINSGVKEATDAEGKKTTETTYSLATYDNMSHSADLYLEGYTYLNPKPLSSSFRDKNKWINDQLDVLKNKGLREALTNGTDTDYRYIVDTFEAFPETGLRNKFAALARDKKNAIVLSNFPAMKSFAKSDAFTDADGVFNTKYIASAYNKSKNAVDMITLPTEVDGAPYIAFFTPLKFNDAGLKINVPSAALVSNNFMDKYTSRQPYYIVAGPSYGRMTHADLIGPDYNFTREDLDYLEPMGVNCMVYKPQRGTFINSNQTAKQVPVTGLSKINIVELVIYIQDTIANMLDGHQWELNTATLRSNIKAKADAICEAVKANGGLYAYDNVCDETNNTDEVIDGEMIVLSTGIEPSKGAGKMVHELTLYRKGGMSSVIK